jgi:hypothetical protein
MAFKNLVVLMKLPGLLLQKNYFAWHPEIAYNKMCNDSACLCDFIGY